MQDIAESGFSFRKPAGATHFKNLYKLSERKLINVCTLISDRSDHKPAKYCIPLPDAFFLMGSETRNIQWMKDVVKGLVTRPIEWNTLGKDRTASWGVCTFLQSGHIANGKLYFRLNDEIRERMKAPSVWGPLMVLIQQKFSMKHAQVLYEFLAVEAAIEGRKGDDIRILIKLDDLREILGFARINSAKLGTKPKYSEFRALNQFVLKPAVKEVNAESDIAVSYEPIRQHNKVDEIAFEISKRKDYQMKLDFDKLPLFAGESVLTADSPADDQQRIYHILADVEIIGKKARELVTEFDPDHIRRNVIYARQQQEKGEVKKSLAGYVISAIDGDWGKKVSLKAVPELEKQFEAKKQRYEGRLKTNRAAEEREKWKKKFDAFRGQQLDQKLAKQNRSWLMRRRNKYLEVMEPIVKKSFANEEWESKIVNTMFRAFVGKELLTSPEEVDLDAFISWSQADRAA